MICNTISGDQPTSLMGLGAQEHEYVIDFIEKLWTHLCFGNILKP